MTVEETLKPVVSDISFSDATTKLNLNPMTVLMDVELRLFGLAETFSKDYKGSLWAGRESVDAVYFVPGAPSTDDGKYQVDVPTNFFSGRLSPDAYGLGLTIFTLNRLINGQRLDEPTEERITKLFYALHDLAASHEEAGAILGFID